MNELQIERELRLKQHVYLAKVLKEYRELEREIKFLKSQLAGRRDL